MVSRATVKRFVPPSALRLRTLLQYHAFTRSPRLAWRYLTHGRELDNFTFDIANRSELASFVAHTCGWELGDVRDAISELEDDDWLRSSIDNALAGRSDREPHMAYGRRAGWYAVARLYKPALIVETGVHDGLGSTVFLRALQRNEGEGTSGTLLSFDIRPDVGWLIPDELRRLHRIIIGDSVAELAPAVGEVPVGVFLHDSLHTYDHETAELEAVLPRAARGAVLMSDNARSGPAMEDFCRRHGLQYALFEEQPLDHFYPGAGIGLTRLGSDAS